MKKGRVFSSASAVVLTVVLMIVITGCGFKHGLRLNNGTASRDGVTVTLKKATARRMSHARRDD